MHQAPPTSDSSVLSTVIEGIEYYLGRALQSRGQPEILEEAIRYAVLSGGKRLRPALVLLSCEAVGGSREDALPPAGAIELIHTFSLVHDDLPAMDDDALRRGRPTLHVQAGEAMAILAGDSMMSIAFELIGEAPLPAEARVRLLHELAASTTSMIGGQVYDTLGGFPHEFTREQRLQLVHRSKTGALVRAACRMGAICGEADGEQEEMLNRYGEAVGLMFQIVDDLLDVTQSTEHLGKTAGKDQSAGKLTYPAILGLERSRSDVRRLRDDAHSAIDGLGAPADPLRKLADEMAVRTR